MTLKPEMVEKAGLSDMMFGDDPRGFIGGLLYEEGATWQRSRKIITEEFNQERFLVKFWAFVGLQTNQKKSSLDSYVDAMDDSVRVYSQKLAAMGKSCSIQEITAVTNQLTLEVMVKTIFGDRSFNLLEINGKHQVFEAMVKICKFRFRSKKLLTG